MARSSHRAMGMTDNATAEPIPSIDDIQNLVLAAESGSRIARIRLALRGGVQLARVALVHARAADSRRASVMTLAHLVLSKSPKADEMAKDIVDGRVSDLAFESFHVEKGAANLAAVGWPALMFAQSCVDLLDARDVVNYIEMQFRAPAGKELVCTVQRYERPTPHELRVKAEAERDESLATLARLRLSRVQNTLRCDVVRSLPRCVNAKCGRFAMWGIDRFSMRCDECIETVRKENPWLKPTELSWAPALRELLASTTTETAGATEGEAARSSQ